jgi:hypothetical protein
MKPMRDPAQDTPRESYILTVKRGKTTPKMDLRTVLPARADAEYRMYVSTR